MPAPVPASPHAPDKSTAPPAGHGPSAASAPPAAADAGGRLIARQHRSARLSPTPLPPQNRRIHAYSMWLQGVATAATPVATGAATVYSSKTSGRFRREVGILRRSGGIVLAAAPPSLRRITSS